MWQKESPGPEPLVPCKGGMASSSEPPCPPPLGISSGRWPPLYRLHGLKQFLRLGIHECSRATALSVAGPFCALLGVGAAALASAHSMPVANLLTRCGGQKGLWAWLCPAGDRIFLCL